MTALNPKKRGREEAHLDSQPSHHACKRRDIVELQSYLESRLTYRIKKCKIKIVKQPPIGRPLSLSQMTYVVYLRFGSLSTDANCWHTAQEVFTRTGIKHGSQYNDIKRW